MSPAGGLLGMPNKEATTSQTQNKLKGLCSILFCWVYFHFFSWKHFWIRVKELRNVSAKMDVWVSLPRPVASVPKISKVKVMDGRKIIV